MSVGAESAMSPRSRYRISEEGCKRAALAPPLLEGNAHFREKPAHTSTILIQERMMTDRTPWERAGLPES